MDPLAGATVEQRAHAAAAAAANGDSDDDGMEISGITFEAFSEAPEPAPEPAATGRRGNHEADADADEEENDEDSGRNNQRSGKHTTIDGEEDGEGTGTGRTMRSSRSRGQKRTSMAASTSNSTRNSTRGRAEATSDGSDSSHDSYTDSDDPEEVQFEHHDTDDASNDEVNYSSTEPSSPESDAPSSDDSDDPEFMPSEHTQPARRKAARKKTAIAAAKARQNQKAEFRAYSNASIRPPTGLEGGRLGSESALSHARKVTTTALLARQVLAAAERNERGLVSTPATDAAKAAIARAEYYRNPRSSESGFFGVSHVGGKWHAHIYKNRQHVNLGAFASREAAADAYHAALSKQSKEEAAYNAQSAAAAMRRRGVRVPTASEERVGAMAQVSRTPPTGLEVRPPTGLEPPGSGLVADADEWGAGAREGGSGGGRGIATPASSATPGTRATQSTASTAASTAAFEQRTGLRLGAKLKARGSDGEWAKARIEDLNLQKAQIKVHYLSWTTTHDEWIPLKSHRLDLPSGNITWPDPDSGDASSGVGGGASGVGGAGVGGASAVSATYSSDKGKGKGKGKPGAGVHGSVVQLGVAGARGSVYPAPRSIPGYANAVEALISSGKFTSNTPSSGYLGVFQNVTDPKKFEAKIYLNRCYEYLGVFASKTEAAAAYDVAAKLYGKRLNYLQAQTNPEINVEVDQLPSLPTPWLGVRKIGSKYRAEIVDDNTKLHIGFFETAEDAARAYDIEAKKAPGAVLNYLPTGKPNMQRLPTPGKLQPGVGLTAAARVEAAGIGVRAPIVDPISQDRRNNYRGVESKSGMWWARISLSNGKHKQLGQWSTPELAAQAYDKEARKHPGKVVNFPASQAEVAAKAAADEAERGVPRRRGAAEALPRPAQRQKMSASSSATSASSSSYKWSSHSKSNTSTAKRMSRLEAARQDALAALAASARPKTAAYQRSFGQPSASSASAVAQSRRPTVAAMVAAGSASSSRSLNNAVSTRVNRQATRPAGSNGEDSAASSSNSGDGGAHAARYKNRTISLMSGSSGNMGSSSTSSGGRGNQRPKALQIRTTARAGIEGMLPDVFVDDSSEEEESEQGQSSDEEQEAETLVLHPGNEIEAQDKKGESWYPCKVVRFVAKKGGAAVRVHYLGWGDRYDEDIALKSKRMRSTGGRVGVICIQGEGGASSNAGRQNGKSGGKGGSGKDAKHYSNLANLRNFTDNTVVKSKVPSVYNELNVPVFSQPKVKDLVAHYFTTGWEHGVIEKKGNGKLPYTVHYKWGGGERLKHALPEDGYNSIWCLLR